MAKLLTGTRIYGTGTVDTQLFVNGTNSATSTTTGALQVVGGVGIGGNLYVGGTIFGGTLSGTASTATNADNIKTILQVSSATYYPAFVDSNNSTAAYEAVYTTSSFVINPGTGKIGIGNPTPNAKLHIGAETEVNITNQSLFVQGTKTGYAGFKGLPLGQLFIYDDTASTAGSGGSIGFGANTGASQRTWIASINSERDSATNDATNYAGSLVFYTRPAQATPEERVRITSTGTVGIGFTAPNGKLDVAGDLYVGATQNTARFKSDGTDTFVDAIPGSGAVVIRAGGSVEKLRVTANGGISFGASGTAYGVSGQILQSNGNAAPTWISTGSLAAANATTATHLSGGVAGQIPYQTAPGVTSFLSTGTAGNVLVSNGSSAPTYNNTLTLTGTTAATSTTTGALQVVGGVGVGGDLYIRGDILTNDTTFNLINTNATTVNFAGAATALTMGASGSGTTNVRNNLTVSGNLTVQGTTTIVDSTVTNIADPIITLGGGTGNSAPTADDNKDRGVAFKWVNNGGTTSTGFFGYDDSTGHFTYVQTATITNEVVSGTKGAMDINLAGGSAMALVYQSSANNTGFLAAGTSGYILQTNGTGSPPTWVSAGGVSAGSATYADNVRTISQAGSAVYYPTFVDSNNATNAYESLYTTSSVSINPATGSITAPSFSIQTNTTPAVLIKDDNLTSWDYSSKSFSVAGQESAPAGIFFKPDGLAMYVVGSTGDDVNQYSLSVAWDVSTAAFVRVSANIGETGPTGVFFKPDGLVMYVTGSTNDTVREFSLSSAWDVSTITFVRDFSVAGQESAPQDLWFKPDGTKMYIVGSTNDRVYEYNLSTAWNVSTASFLQFFSVAAQETVPVAVNFNSDGTKMYVLGDTGDDINRYTLSTPWDISTAVFFNNFYVGFQETSVSGLFINFDSNTAYVVGSSTDAVYQYATLTDGIELISSSGLFINGSLYANKNLLVTAGTRIDGTLSVSSAATLNSSLTVSSAATLNSSLTVSSTANLNGSVSMGTTTSAINIGTSQSTGATIIGGTAQTGGLTLGRSTGAQTVDIAVGATTNGTIKLINVGANGVSGSTTNVNIGSAVAGALGTLTINSIETVITPTTNASSTATGALQVRGGVGIGGNLWVGGTINGNISGNAGTSGQVSTIQRITNASHFLTFVDSNNASNAYEAVYTTSSFVINPQSGNVGIGTQSPGAKLDIKLAADGDFLVGRYSAGTAKLIYAYQSGSDGYLELRTGTDAIVTKLSGYTGTPSYFLSNVGIGTSSPSVKLHIKGTEYAQYIETASTTDGDAIRLALIGPGAQSQVELEWWNDSTKSGGGYGLIQTGKTGNSPSFNFMVGKVGIGTIDPQVKLHVYTSDASVNSSFLIEHGNTSRYALMQFKGAGAKTFEIGTGGSGTGSYNGALYFYDVTASAERMRITSAGGIAFGGSANYGSSGQVLKSNGDAPPTWINQSSIAAGSAPLTNTYVGYGSASNLLTGSSNVTWNGTAFYVNGNVGVQVGSPISKLQVGSHTFSGVNGVYSNARSGLSVNGSLTSIVYASTYNDSTYPDYGMVFVHGPSTSSYNVWSISPDGPAKGSGLGFLYGANADNIHVNAPKVYFQGSTGKVGIGTSSPDELLTVAGNVLAYGSANSVGAGTAFYLGNLANSRDISFTRVGTAALGIGRYNGGWYESLRIDANGNLGVGVTSPEYLVDLGTINEEFTTDKIRFNSYNGPAGGVSGYGGTGGSGTSLGSGIIWKPNYSGYTKRSAGILNIAEGNYFRSGLAFYTNNITDSSTDWTEAMRIGSNGNVQIGGGSNPGLLNKFEVTGTAGQLLSVSDSFTGTVFAASDVSGIPSIEVLDTGLVKLAQYNGQVTINTGTAASSTASLTVYGMIYTSGALGEIRASSEITAYYSSDARLKENVKLIENPITIIDQIRGVTFDWTDEHIARRGGEDGFFVRKHDIGVIAQEVQAVLPELVGTRADGYLAVKYEKLVPLLIEAIKEQQKTIDMLVNDITKIKDVLESLRGQ